MAVLHSAPRFASNEDVLPTLTGALGVIDPGDVHQLLVFVVVAQQAYGIFDPVPLDGEDHFAVRFSGRDKHRAERL